MEKTISIDEKVDLKKISLLIACFFIITTIGFYFLAGEQLHFRQSRNNIEINVADSITTELSKGALVEQIFVSKIHRLEEISVQYATFQRPNKGTITMELYDVNNGTLLLSKTIDIRDIKEGELISLKFPSPVEGLYNVPLLIKISSFDSELGSGATTLMTKTASKEGYQLLINGNKVNGILCFSAKGTDYIWIGLHYWEIIGIIGLFLVTYLLLANYKYARNKKSLLLYFLIAIKKYRFLIRQLIARDFRTKYKRSFLGVLWSFLNPLLMMMVQYFVFSNIFRMEVKNYPVYLLIGVVMFNFFIEACSMTLMSIVGNASLITKVYVPKYIYPISRTLSSSINLLISLLPLFVVIILTGTSITPAYILIVFALLFILIFSLGLGMLLSSSMVFFRDTQFLWGVLSMIWMYATPIFYPESIIPEKFKFVIELNPLYYFIKIMRTCIIDGVSPEPFLYVQSAFIAIGMFAIGSIVFKKTQDKFVLYI